MYKKNSDLPPSVRNLSDIGQTLWRNEYNSARCMMKAWGKVESAGLMKAEDYNGQPRGEDGRFKPGKQDKKKDVKTVAGAFPVYVTNNPPDRRPPSA